MTSFAEPGASRRAARERAFELLYQADVMGERPADVLRSVEAPPDPYVVDLLEFVDRHGPTLDGLIESRLREDWSWERIPHVERALLRLGAAELIGVPEVPTAVVLAEAVDLAQRYTTPEGAKFVNGLLAELARELRTSDDGDPMNEV
ncbi:MAG: N utilization substance protein B [Acidimicrobiales bacterium]|nr:MAG: N utilization substance protein B [Acidimicrobiales bacterium]